MIYKYTKKLGIFNHEPLWTTIGMKEVMGAKIHLKSVTIFQDDDGAALVR